MDDSLLFVMGYIDPGTGSIILQAIVAGIVGGAVAVKLFWHRIRTFFGMKKRNKKEDITDS